MSRMDDLLDACPELMSASEVAVLLGVTPRTVLAWLKAEQLPGYRLPSEWRISREELREWLRRAHNQAQAEKETGPPE